MANSEIKLTLEGKEEDSGHLDIKAFLKELGMIQAALAQIDKMVRPNDQASVRFLIADLSHSSPVAVGLMPRHQGLGPDYSAEVVSMFSETIRGASSGNIPESLDHSLLEKFMRLGKDNSFTKEEIQVSGEAFRIDKSFSQNIVKALDRNEECWGSIEGPLEAINVHGKQHHFVIYPEVGPTKIRCTFPEPLHDHVIANIEKRLLVSGKMLYRRNASFPHEIIVESFDVLPDDEDLPTFDDLRGIVKDDDSRLAEDIIREQRDDWE